MEPQIYIDLARYAHILAVAVGFGAAFLTDLHVLSRMGKVIDDAFIATIHSYHRIITYSVVLMWVTGLVMIYIRTGFDPANFTPKLITKLVIVTVLSINAGIIAKVLMPMINNCRGQSLLWLPVGTQVWLAVIGAISTSSWMLALLLGTSKFLAGSGQIVFLILVPVVYGAALIGATTGVRLLHAFGRNLIPAQPKPQPRTKSRILTEVAITRAFRAVAG